MTETTLNPDAALAETAPVSDDESPDTPKRGLRPRGGPRKENAKPKARGGAHFLGLLKKGVGEKANKYRAAVMRGQEGAQRVALERAHDDLVLGMRKWEVEHDRIIGADGATYGMFRARPLFREAAE